MQVHLNPLVRMSRVPQADQAIVCNPEEVQESRREAKRIAKGRVPSQSSSKCLKFRVHVKGVVLRKDVFLPSKHLLSAFYKTLASKNPSKNLVFAKNPYKRLVRTLLRLRGPVAILFISRDTCSDSIAKLFRACFCGVSHNYRAIRCKMGYRTDAPV